MPGEPGETAPPALPQVDHPGQLGARRRLAPLVERDDVLPLANPGEQALSLLLPRPGSAGGAPGLGDLLEVEADVAGQPAGVLPDRGGVEAGAVAAHAEDADAHARECSAAARCGVA